MKQTLPLSLLAAVLAACVTVAALAQGPQPTTVQPAGAPTRRLGTTRTSPARPGGSAAAASSGATTLIATNAAPNTLAFVEAPLDTVIMDYCLRTQRTAIFHPETPKPNITLRSAPEQELTDEEYLFAIAQGLNMHGVAIEHLGTNFVRVLPASKLRKLAPDTTFGPNSDRFRENGDYVSRMIELKHVKIEEAKTVIDNFIRDGAQVQTFERTNSILVTDASDNVNRILEIIEFIDRPLQTTEQKYFIHLQAAKASDVKARLLEVIQEIQGDAQQQQKNAPVERNYGRPLTVNRPVPGGTNPRLVNTPATTTPAKTDATVDSTERSLIQGKISVVADDRTNTLIIISPPANEAFFTEIIAKLDIATTPDVISQTVRLEHAVAKDVASLLNDLIGNSKSSSDDDTGHHVRDASDSTKPATTTTAANRPATSGASAIADGQSKIGRLDKENITILADERTNALVIMASPRDMESINELIRQIDIPLSQVVIETVIVEVTFNDTNETGFDWVQRNVVAAHNSDGKVTLRAAGSAGGGTGRVPINLLGQTTEGVINFANTVSTAGTGGANFFLSFANLKLDMIFKAVAEDSRARLMSSPRITTMDNKEAVLESTERIYWSEGSTHYTSSDYYSDNIKNEDVGIKLTVTPRINKSGYIILTVEQEYQAVSGYATITTSGQNSEYPNLTSRKMGADVAVNSGDTIVLGGLAQNKVTTKHSKVPVLGSIPLLGRLFRYDTEERNRSELIVFLTPRVVDTPAQIEDDSRNAKASLDTDGVWDASWSASRIADPPSEKRREETLENGRKTVVPPDDIPLTRQLRPIGRQ